ncbi:MAG: hypothetical protein IKL39_05670 [Mailhella sp.]|nr:hypothetical protein [Mailhella sp.]
MLDLSQRIYGRLVNARPDGVADFLDAEGRLCRVQEVGGILRLNSALRAESGRKCGFRPAPVFRRVASIPLAVVDIAKAQGLDLMRDPEALRRFLNDRGNSAFRTTEERV